MLEYYFFISSEMDALRKEQEWKFIMNLKLIELCMGTDTDCPGSGWLAGKRYWIMYHYICHYLVWNILLSWQKDFGPTVYTSIGGFSKGLTDNILLLPLCLCLHCCIQSGPKDHFSFTVNGIVVSDFWTPLYLGKYTVIVSNSSSSIQRFPAVY